MKNMKEIFDYKINKNKIHDSILTGDNVKVKTYKYLVSGFTILIICGVLFILNNRKEDILIDNSFNDNKTDDEIIFNDLNIGNESKSSADIDGHTVDITMDELYSEYSFVKEFNIPSDFTSNRVFKYYSKDYTKGMNSEYNIFEGYEIIYYTQNNRNIDIFMLKNNKVRARCYSLNLEDMNVSKINNTIVKIMVNGNNYIAIFSYNNINYDIETNGISKEEFINILNSIIK